MKIPYHVYDAFAEGPFMGNPAGVCPLEEWLSDDLLLNIAAENKHSETAFYIPHTEGEAYQLRWFTPGGEVDLCGHATLATGGHLLQADPAKDSVCFSSRSGPLTVNRLSEDRFSLDFPVLPVDPLAGHEALKAWLGDSMKAVFTGMDVLAVLMSESDVRSLKPDLDLISTLGSRGLIVTGASDDPNYDFVSRYFAPSYGIPEDPVTGSIHCSLIPYWAEQLGKTELVAFQASERTGLLQCRLRGDRVDIGGRIHKFCEGVIFV